MKKKGILSLLACLCATTAVFGMAACGGNDSSSSETPVASDSSSGASSDSSSDSSSESSSDS